MATHLALSLDRQSDFTAAPASSKGSCLSQNHVQKPPLCLTFSTDAIHHTSAVWSTLLRLIQQEVTSRHLGHNQSCFIVGMLRAVG